MFLRAKRDRYDKGESATKPQHAHWRSHADSRIAAMSPAHATPQTKDINNTMKEKKSKTLGERLPETTIADKLFRAAAQRAAREAREKRQK